MVTALVFHEIGETRIGDLNNINKKYLPKENELKAVEDQVKNLFPEILRYVKKRKLIKEHIGKIIYDADLLENVLTAKEYIKIGFQEAETWIKNIEKNSKTKSGKKLFKIILKTDPQEYLKDLNK